MIARIAVRRFGLGLAALLLLAGLGSAAGASTAQPARPSVPLALSVGEAATSASALTTDVGGDFSDVSYQVRSGATYYRTFGAGVWSGASDLGGLAVGAPTAATAGRAVSVFVRGVGPGGLFVKSHTGAGWGAWQPLGGNLTAAPAAAGWVDGRIDVVVRGTADALYGKVSTPAGGWSGWSGLGGRLSTGPAVVASGSGVVDVFAAGTDHAVWHRSLARGVWSPWASLGGLTYTAPAVARDPRTGQLALFVRGTSNALYVKVRTGETWSGWRSLGGVLIDAPGSTGVSGGVDVVVRGTGRALHAKTFRNGVKSAYVTAWAPAADPPLAAGLRGRDWETIPTSARQVALTFDAGANADGVPKIRAALQRALVPATFFLTGRWAGLFPAQANEIAVAGFAVGNHSMTHPSFTPLSDAAIRTEVVSAATAILRANGVSAAPLFRFPYGDRDARTIGTVNGLGYVPVRWTVDTLGWEGTSGGSSVAQVVARVLGALRPGQIVLMHVGSHPTDHSTLDADALPTVISELRARGYTFVTLRMLAP